jgi:hypothetical protein
MGFFKELVQDVVEYYEQQDLAPDEIAAILYMREEEIRAILGDYSSEYREQNG